MKYGIFFALISTEFIIQHKLLSNTSEGVALTRKGGVVLIMKILICYDGSPASHMAMEKTIEFFKQRKPEIILVTVVEQPLDASLENEDIFDKWRQERHIELKKASSFISDHGLNVDSILAVGDPRKMILEIINKKLPDLVVVARRGKTEMEKMLLGSVSAFLVRHSTRPMLIMT